MATVQDLGKVAYFNKGAYNSETTYEINDVVSYNGSSYVSLGNDNLGNLPTNTAFWSIVASKGDKGDTGKPFVIEKTYESIEDMVDDYDNMNVNDYVMIQGNIEEEENATLWVKTDTEVSPYKWVYLADFSGASGITGATPNIQIGNVTEGNQPSVTRRAGSTNENPILDFVLKTGAKGDTGATGNGISGVAKTSTSGLVDTYTISYTSGNSSTFDVHNGKGISSIAKTSSVGLVDTYTITYNDGTTSTFDITNGEDGSVTQEQLDETNAEVERVNMVYNALPKVSGEGTDLTLNNTAECPVYEIGLRPSELSQAPSSRNLVKIDNNNAIVYSNYNHYNINDGVITTASGNTLVGFKVKVDANTDYTLQGYSDFTDSTGTYTLRTREYSAEPIDWETNFIHQESVNMVDETKNVLSITTTQTTTWVLVVVYCNKAGLTLNNIQFEEGTTATDFKPYVSPTPTPEYPQDIHVVTGDNSVVISNKNLFDKTRFKQIGRATYTYSNGVYTITPTGAGNVSLTLNIDLPAGTYTYQGYSQGTTQIRNSSHTVIANNINTNHTFTISETSTEIVFNWATGTSTNVFTVDMNDIQIEDGSTASSFEPRRTQTYPISLGDLEYCKIGDYEDVFFKNVVGSEYYDSTLQVGKWYLKKNVDKIVLDGTEAGWVQAESAVPFRYPKTNIVPPIADYSTPYLVCDYFEPIDWDTAITTAVDYCITMTYSSSTSLRFKNVDISTLDSFKNWLSTHNTTVYYLLQTPTYTLLNNTLQTQLDNIQKAISHQDQTNVSQTNNDLPFVIKMSAIRDLSGIFDLISQSEEI